MMTILFLLFGLICITATFLGVQIQLSKQDLERRTTDLKKLYQDFEASLTTVVADHNVIMQTQDKQQKEIERLTMTVNLLGVRK